MEDSIRGGLYYGMSSAAITALGLMIGLNSGTKSQTVVLAGLLTMALADSLSDALGIHLSEESREDSTGEAVWAATFTTFTSKFIVLLSFIPAIYFLDLEAAIPLNVLWGFLVVTVLSYQIAVSQNTSPKKAISEHLLIAVVVVLATNFLGIWISGFAG
ncbi:MAG: hypothetical protein GF334_11265 [Candidatus Altiarchaeales archaeon]|nr:hypothetical protein [Candidatus Altiarchaeales archaeon]